MSNPEVLHDIERHLTRRLETVLIDAVSTCRIAGVDKSEVVAMIVTALFDQLLRATQLAGLDEKDFLRTCSMAYRTMVTSRKIKGTMQ